MQESNIPAHPYMAQICTGECTISQEDIFHKWIIYCFTTAMCCLGHVQ